MTVVGATLAGMTTYFTADPHFGHARLLELSAARGAAFGSVEEMDRALVERWNETVGADDTVWVLGDFDMHGKDTSLGLVPRLAGTKILVSGNHDACWGGVRDGWRQRDRYLRAGFAAVLDFATLSLPPRRRGADATRVVLSHFPYAGDSQERDRYAQFRLRDEGRPLLHGHVHESFRESQTKQGTWTINVGVDMWDYRPVSAEVLAAHLARLRAGGVTAGSEP
jgi:calcineurin-like phosphoesterase family protein